MAVNLLASRNHCLVDGGLIAPTGCGNQRRDAADLGIDQTDTTQTGIYATSRHTADDVILGKAGQIDLAESRLNLAGQFLRAQAVDNDLPLGKVVVDGKVNALHLVRQHQRIQNDGVALDDGAAVGKGKLLVGLFGFLVHSRIKRIDDNHRSNVAGCVVKMQFESPHTR